MPIEGQTMLVRIFIGESDTWHGQPLYDAIVQRAREEGLAGATVLRGIEGFGANSHLRTTRILQLSSDLPLLIEIVDSETKIRAFLPTLEDMVKEGLVTTERVEVVLYRGNEEKQR